MIRTYTRNDVLAAWRRRQGLASGWLSVDDAMQAGMEEAALEEIRANYARLLREAPPEMLPAETFSFPETLPGDEGIIRLVMPDRVVRPLEARLSDGRFTDRFRRPEDAIPDHLLSSLTGGNRPPVAVVNGRELRIHRSGSALLETLVAIASPADDTFVLSPELFPSLFEYYETKH